MVFLGGGRVLENQATGVSGELEFEGIVRIVPSFSEKKNNDQERSQ